MKEEIYKSITSKVLDNGDSIYPIIDKYILPSSSYGIAIYFYTSIKIPEQNKLRNIQNTFYDLWATEL